MELVQQVMAHYEKEIVECTHVLPDLIDDNWIIQPDKFTDNMIIDAAQEHVNGMAHTLAEMVGDRGMVYSHDPEDHMKLPNLKYYASGYYYVLKLFKPVYMQNTITSNQYTVSCLNNAPRNHRILLYIISDKPSNQLWTMHNFKGNVGNDHEIELPNTIALKWNAIKHQFTGRVIGVESQNQHEAYSSSLINIATETVMTPGVFITEKTWKPIASAQLFFVLGSPGTIAHLRSLGIDCFDDIIDNTYDDILDPVDRTYALRDSVKKLLTQDTTDLNTHTVERRINNAEKFWSGKLYTKYE